MKRLCSIAVSILIFALHVSAQAPGSTIEGVVARADTGSGIAEALVAILKRDGSLLQSVTTDSTGHFIAKGVPPGTYSVQVNHPGYTSTVASQESVTVVGVNVQPAENIPQLKFGLVPMSVIYGRIVDSDGNPISGLRVEALELSYDDLGRRVWAQSAFTKVTDDRGDFRLFQLKPGEYYIRAARRSNLLNINDGNTSQVADMSIAYFPGVRRASLAQKIILNAGEPQFAGFTVPKSDTHSISGRISNRVVNDKSVPMTSLIVIPRDSEAPFEAHPNLLRLLVTPEGTNGEFKIFNVPPGEYDIYAQSRISAGDDGIYVASMSINVGKDDVAGLELELEPGVDLKGRVTIIGNQPTKSGAPGSVPPNPNTSSDTAGSVGGGSNSNEEFRILLQSLDNNPNGGRVSAAVDNSGNFIFRNISKGIYQITLAGKAQSRGGFVSDIRQGSESVLDTGFIVSKEIPAPLEVVFDPISSSIHGIISGMKLGNAQIALIPETASRNNPALFKTAIVLNREGKFTILGVAAGRYHLFAWENSSSPTTLFRDPQFIEMHAAEGVSIKVERGLNLSDIKVPLMHTAPNN